MRNVIGSIESEYRRYMMMADKTMAQLTDDQLFIAHGSESNSVAVIVRHVGGNLRSRFTNFLAEDGEKAWRRRDEEFEAAGDTREQIMSEWEQGWAVLLNTLASLTDADLTRTVSIRLETMPVHAALHRSLAHTASHVGQIVYVAKALRGADWQTLSILRGKSAEANKATGAKSEGR
jgi:Protein of unknown function (DUF1572)